MPLSYAEFKSKVSTLVGIDLFLYKSQQMDRRIHSLMTLWGLKSYEEYLEVLTTNPIRFQEFLKKLTINVSEFFRNPERYMDLWKTILPELLKERPRVKIWSAGCSNGAEPYSVAIILNELSALSRATLLGTDLDATVLAKAQAGMYAENELKSLPRELVEKYFRKDNGYYYLSDYILKAVTFKKHNLLVDKFEHDFDLIICRNVVIYFTEEAKNELYKKFYRSLRPGGYFWVGGTEPLLNYKALGFENTISSFYKKIKTMDGE